MPQEKRKENKMANWFENYVNRITPYDAARVRKGNVFQKAAGAVGILGSAINGPELGASEMWGIPKAQAAELTTGLNNNPTALGGGGGGSYGSGDTTETSNPGVVTQNEGSDAGGGGGTSFDQWFNGVHYTDPINYANAVNQAAVEAYNAANKSLQEAYTKGLIDIAQYEEQLVQNRETIKRQYGDAMSVVSGRFAAQGPNVYQSEQGNKEGIIKDVTDQNYANQATAEANLGLQKTGFENEYQSKLEQNRQNQQSVIDDTMNQLASNLQGTAYSNSLNQVQAPTINNATLDNSFMNTYNTLKGLKGPAIKSTIDASNQPQNIKDWLYTKYANQF